MRKLLDMLAPAGRGYGSSSRLVTELPPPPRRPTPGGARPGVD